MSKTGVQIENPYYEIVDGQCVPTAEGRREIGAMICRAYRVKQYEIIDHTSPSPTESTPQTTLESLNENTEGATR